MRKFLLSIVVKYSVAVVITVALFPSCASNPPAKTPPETPPAVEAPPAPADEQATADDSAEIEELYARLEETQDDYEEAIELMSAGEDVENAILETIMGRLRAGAEQCAETRGCELGRFFDAVGNLMEEQSRALKSQSARIENLEPMSEEDMEEDIEREPGTSPFVSDIPELGETVSLLRGTDLRDIIELNGPVQAALDDWLTWNRPMLLESYVNYKFLSTLIAPVYEEAGLPEALLFAMIATETGGKVHAYSRAGAAGLLQFMRRTGHQYGLKTVDGFDLRLDPVSSTKANVAYLNDQFKVLNNNLDKALAAYNGGENRMKRLHRQYKDASVWDNRIYYRLPRETREYVPRVLAAAWLFLHPEDYKLEWPELSTDVTQLTVQKDVSLGELTICLGQEGNPYGWFRTLRNLNPRLNPGERVKAGETIDLPAMLTPLYESQCLDGPLVQTAEELHDANYPYGEMIAYTVQPGDTLGRIASRFQCVSTRELASINNVRPPSYIIRVGQRLRIPNCGY